MTTVSALASRLPAVLSPEPVLGRGTVMEQSGEIRGFMSSLMETFGTPRSARS
jgi:hypothetical protein